jgi:hypothetical protein
MERTWLDDTPYNLLERNLKWLGKTMLAGAVWDVLLALVSLVFPGWLAGVMGLTLPQPVFYFYLWSIIHLVFACFGVLAWMDTKRNIVIVIGAITGRVIYAVFMFLSVLFLDVRPAWAIAGGISLILAVVHYVLLRLSDFGFWEVFIQAGNPPGMRRTGVQRTRVRRAKVQRTGVQRTGVRRKVQRTKVRRK